MEFHQDSIYKDAFMESRILQCVTTMRATLYRKADSDHISVQIPKVRRRASFSPMNFLITHC